jgi:hypothetical protein
MPKSIFDSDSERKVFARLNRKWSRYVDVYPHIPVRNVLGFNELRALDISENAKEYLQKTEFDYVVCEQGSSIPRLAVEFDGLGHGFSRDGNYIPLTTPINDRYRKLKLDAKLSACEALGFSLVIVSYPETKPLWQNEDALMILDAIIGEVLASIKTSEQINQQMDYISTTLEQDPTGETTDWALFNIEMESQFTNNPIRRRTAEMHTKIPIHGYGVRFLRDRPGYVGGCFYMTGGVHFEQGVSRMQVLLSVDIYLRDLNCIGCSSAQLLESVGEYLLARKALRDVSTDRAKWQELLQSAPWV